MEEGRGLEKACPLRQIANQADRRPTHAGQNNHSCLGIGLILGAGIFVSTGEAANGIAG